jgi:hypothetical protein
VQYPLLRTDGSLAGAKNWASQLKLTDVESLDPSEFDRNRVQVPIRALKIGGAGVAFYEFSLGKMPR